MNYPDCPDRRKDCRFERLGGAKTMMYSPIIYNREGKPVGGGANVCTYGIRCGTCGKFFTARQTDLETAQGKPRNWECQKQ